MNYKGKLTGYILRKILDEQRKIDSKIVYIHSNVEVDVIFFRFEFVFTFS